MSSHHVLLCPFAPLPLIMSSQSPPPSPQAVQKHGWLSGGKSNAKDCWAVITKDGRFMWFDKVTPPARINEKFAQGAIVLQGAAIEPNPGSKLSFNVAIAKGGCTKRRNS